MKKTIIVICLFTSTIGNCLAQTVVKMMMPEQAKEVLSVVTLFSESLPVNTPIVLGAIGYDIKGGAEPYTLSWMKDESVISTGNIVVFTPVTGSSYKLKVVDKNNCSTDIAINVSASSKMRKENVSDSKIMITPTIVTNEITVGFVDADNNIAQVKIFDTRGVLRQNAEVTGNTTLQVSFSPGTYFVVVEKSGQYYTQKIIVR